MSTATAPTNAAGPAPRGPGRLHNMDVHRALQAGAAAAPVRARGGAIVVLVLCGALTVVTAWLDLRAPSHGPGVDIADGPGWPYAVNGLVLGVLAAVVVLHGRARRLGWLIGLLAMFWALDGLSQAYVRTGLRPDEAWAGMTFALWFLNRFGAFLPVAIGLLLLVFPTGRLLPGRWGRLGAAAACGQVLAGLAFLVTPADAHVAAIGVPDGVDLDPTSIDALRPFGEQIAVGALAVGVTSFLLTLLLVVVRYRSSTGVMRDRMRWLAWSVVVIVAFLVAEAFVQPVGLAYVTTVVVMVLPAAAMTVAVVRPAVLPIDDLLPRTLVVAVVMSVLVAADIAVLALLTLLIDDDSLTQRQVIAVVLLIAVALYGPLRRRLSAVVRRRLLGQRHNPYDALAGLSSTLENTDDAAEQLSVVARSVASAFGVGFVGVEVDWTSGERMVTTYGERPDKVRTLPITYRGTSVGRLVLPAGGVRSRLSARDEQLLGDLVRQAATAVRTSRLAGELQESRERLVGAREEERSRIRRDLHDGLGPALSGVVFQLEAARMTVDRDPERVKEQLAAVSASVQAVVGDVRRLVHGLRPPALDDRGLVAALGQQAERLGVPLTVEVAASAGDGLDGLSAAVEVAAYRIAGEALTNVARHAAASAARLRLEVADGALLVEVSDDGIGIDPDRQAGVGLASLRERAAELGGRTEITCPVTGGTTVRAWLPMRRTT